MKCVPIYALKEGVSALEFTARELIQHALERSEGDHKEAARLLDTTLNKLRESLPKK